MATDKNNAETSRSCCWLIMGQINFVEFNHIHFVSGTATFKARSNARTDTDQSVPPGEEQLAQLNFSFQLELTCYNILKCLTSGMDQQNEFRKKLEVMTKHFFNSLLMLS